MHPNQQEVRKVIETNAEGEFKFNASTFESKCKVKFFEQNKIYIFEIFKNNKVREDKI